jgi:hypothetical protein
MINCCSTLLHRAHSWAAVDCTAHSWVNVACTCSGAFVHAADACIWSDRLQLPTHSAPVPLCCPLADTAGRRLTFSSGALRALLHVSAARLQGTSAGRAPLCAWQWCSQQVAHMCWQRFELLCRQRTVLSCCQLPTCLFVCARVLLLQRASSQESGCPLPMAA